MKLQYTHFFPSNSGHKFCNIAARPTAPAPSTTAFSCSTSRKMDSAIKFSLEYKKQENQFEKKVITSPDVI